MHLTAGTGSPSPGRVLAGSRSAWWRWSASALTFAYFAFDLTEGPDDMAPE
jgi:hypothetical protein